MVSTTRLVAGIWSGLPPAGAVNAVHALVSRLRRMLPAPIESHSAGYRLVIESDAVDATRFERMVAAGRAELADDPASAARILAEALSLWWGPALLHRNILEAVHSGRFFAVGASPFPDAWSLPARTSPRAAS